MPLGDLAAKWRAFGWHIVEIDGHNMRQVLDALDAVTRIHAQPALIIAHTIKGKGVSFMENTATWHGRAPQKEEFVLALTELQDGMGR